MTEAKWIDVGASDELAGKPVQELRVGAKRIALTCRDGQFGAISGVCNHVGGPLGNGRLDGDYVVCPWHSGQRGTENQARPPGARAASARTRSQARIGT